MGAIEEVEQIRSPSAPAEAHPRAVRARRPTLERSFGLIAGILFIGGAFAGIPSSLLIDPAPPASLYLITVASVAFGLAAIAIPWDRVSYRWVHLAMVLAIAQVGLAVALAGDPFVFYFVFVAIFAAYAFRDRSQVAVYVGLITLALLLPILLIGDSTRATPAQAVAAIPAIVLVSVMVAFLRERLQDNRRTTRLFAREALALSVRIGRLPAPVVEPAPEATPAGAPRHAVLRLCAIAISALLVALAGLGTLTAAGVAMPGSIEDSFSKVGIEPSGGGSQHDDATPRHRRSSERRAQRTAARNVRVQRTGAKAQRTGGAAKAKRGKHEERHKNQGGEKTSNGDKSESLHGSAGANQAKAPAQAAAAVPADAAGDVRSSAPNNDSGSTATKPSSEQAEHDSAPLGLPSVGPVHPPKPPTTKPPLVNGPQLGDQISSAVESLLGQGKGRQGD